jgi:hypothetical protein
MQVEEKIIDNETCFLFSNGKKQQYLISTIDISFLINKFDFLFKITKNTEGNQMYSLCSKLSKQLIPEVKAGGKTFYGPADGLSNILFHEYIHTETFYANYVKKQNVSSSSEAYRELDKLIAVLYREQVKNYDPHALDYNGDRREPFNDWLIDSRSLLISKLSLTTKNAILLYYTGCVNLIQLRFPEVFTPDSKPPAPDSKLNNTFINMMKLVTALTDNDVTKNEEVRKTNLYEIMISLQQMRIQSDMVKEQIKKHQTHNS